MEWAKDDDYSVDLLEFDLAALRGLIAHILSVYPSLERLQCLKTEKLQTAQKQQVLDFSEWCSPTEAARLMRCTKPNVKYHITKGSLSAQKVNGRWWITRHSVEEYCRAKFAETFF